MRIALIFLLFPLCANAFIEIGGNFGYEKQVFGTDDQNDSITRTYAATWAWYFSSYTAVEFNYSVSQEETTSRETIDYEDWDVSISKIFNEVNTTVYGIGIRQAFAGKNAFMRPLLSIGYARQVETSHQDITFLDEISGESLTVPYPQSRTDYDSIFASFSLQFKITQLISLKGSINTIFPAFQFDQAKNNLKYLAGFTWAF